RPSSNAIKPEEKGRANIPIRPWPAAITELRQFKGHTLPVNSLAISADGSQALSGSGDRTLRLWDVETGQHIRSFEGHTAPVRCVAISHDGQFALSGSND